MTVRRVVDRNEIRLAAYGQTGAGGETRAVRLRLAKGGSVSQQVVDLFPSRISINDAGRAPGGLASSITLQDASAGLGIHQMRQDGSAGRFDWSTCYTEFPNQVTLPAAKTARPNADAAARVPRCGIAWKNKVYVAFDDRVYGWTEGVGWGASLHTFPGGSTPTSDPVPWGSYLFFFLGAAGIDFTDGTTWTHIAQDAVAGVVIGDVLLIVTSGGLVRRTATQPPLLASFSDVVSVDDAPSAMFAYTVADGTIAAYVVGARTLYAIDTDTTTAWQAGPRFGPSPWPIRAVVYTGDNTVYIAQGASVVSWDGDTANAALGLDRDDGLPIACRGGIVRLANGNDRVFALVDASKLDLPDDMDLYSGGPWDDTLGGASACAVVYARTGRGWHYRAQVEDVTSGSMLFLSDSEGTYRLWFAIDGVTYTTTLQQNLWNPVDERTIEWAASGYHDWPDLTLSFLEHPKKWIAVQLRAAGTSNDPAAYRRVRPQVRFDGGGAWHDLYDMATGRTYVDTDGRHTFLLHGTMVPAATSPLSWADEPATGHRADTMQLRGWLEMPAPGVITPRLSFMNAVAMKSQPPLSTFTCTVAIDGEYKGLTARQQERTLLALLGDNTTGLLALTFNANEADNGADDIRTYAVQYVTHDGRKTGGTDYDLRASIQLRFTEVFRVEAT